MNLNLNTTEWLLIALVTIDALMLAGIALMILHRSPPVAGNGDSTHPVLERLANEPVRVRTAIMALIAVGASFGLPVSDGQQAAIIAGVLGILTLFAESTRAEVTPVRKLSPTTIAKLNK